MLKIGSITTIIRGISLLGKFFLVIYLAKFLSLEEMGIYGFISILISYFLYILGLEFYMFNTREILNNKILSNVFIRDQFILHLSLYLVSFPFAYLFIRFSHILSEKYIFWFFSLVTLEHLSQEVYRLLVTFSKPIHASWLMFFRTGFWVFIVLFLMFIETGFRNLDTVFIGWSASILISLIYMLKYIKIAKWIELCKLPVNWSWLKKGVKISSPFLLSIVAIKGIEFSDRFFIKYFYGDQLLGVYTLFISFANAVQAFVYSGVFLILFPKLIQNYQNKNFIEYHADLTKLKRWGVSSSILFALIAGVVIYPILIYIDKAIYIKNISSFWLLLISVTLSSISQIVHIQLYILKADKQIIISSILCLFLVVISNYFLTARYGLIGASVSSIIGSSFLLLYKYLILNIKYIQEKN